MLLRFGVGNFRSIKDYMDVSLIASNAIKDSGPHLFSVPGGKQKALPFLLIYGANASGKSSIYHALGLMKRHVQTSFTARQPGEKLGHAPFALGEEMTAVPTRVDCDIVVESVRYHYGFEFDDNAYHSEWLYSFPEGHRRVLFHRSSPDEIEFGSTLRGKNKTIAEFNRDNSLFLSTAAQNNHAQITPVYKWFEQLAGVTPSINNSTIKKKLSQNVDSRIVPFLRNADTGIVGANIVSEDLPEKVIEIYNSMKAVVNKRDPDDIRVEIQKPQQNVQVSLVHKGGDGVGVELPFDVESRGTRRLIGLLVHIFKIIDDGGVIFIDELDASLHSLLSMKIIELFSFEEFNKNGAQLIATTHDTNILCSDNVRRDQIWFTEKDSYGATEVFPLTDIKTRNSDNLERAYLQGRFGAIPYLGSIKDLLADSCNG